MTAKPNVECWAWQGGSERKRVIGIYTEINMSSDHEFSITHEAGTMVLEANRLLAEEELKGTEVIRKPLRLMA